MIPDLEVSFFLQEHRRRIASATTEAWARGHRRVERRQAARWRVERRRATGGAIRARVATRVATRLRRWADLVEPPASGYASASGPVRAAESAPAPASGRTPSRPPR